MLASPRESPPRQEEIVIATDPIEQRVREVLDGLARHHEMVEIDPQYADTAAFCAQYGYPMEQSANTIIVGSKKEPKRYCACVVRATRRLDVNHTVRKLLGVSRLSFADVQDFEDAGRGFVATLPEVSVRNAQGRVVWSLGEYAFLEAAEAPAT